MIRNRIKKQNVDMDKTYETVRRIIWAILDDGHLHSQRVVSDEWLIPRTTVNTIVKNMVSDGYIAFHPEQRTKEKTIMLTEKGRRYVDEQYLFRRKKRAMQDTLEHFGDCLYKEYSKIICHAQP